MKINFLKKKYFDKIIIAFYTVLIILILFFTFAMSQRDITITYNNFLFEEEIELGSHYSTKFELDIITVNPFTEIYVEFESTGKVNVFLLDSNHHSEYANAKIEDYEFNSSYCIKSLLNVQRGRIDLQYSGLKNPVYLVIEPINENVQIYCTYQYLISEKFDFYTYYILLMSLVVLSLLFSIIYINKNPWSNFCNLLVKTSKKQFKNKDYTNSILSAFKEINHMIKAIFAHKFSKEDDGPNLMMQVFNEKDPLVILDNINTKTGKNVQEGYKFIFTGAHKAFRNPKAHQNFNLEKNDALSQLYLANNLMLTLLNGKIEDNGNMITVEKYLEKYNLI